MPGIGAILQPVDVRLSPDQIACTLRHLGALVLLYHPDLTPLWQHRAGQSRPRPKRAALHR